MDTAEVGPATAQRAFGSGDGRRSLAVDPMFDYQTPRGGLKVAGGDRCGV